VLNPTPIIPGPTTQGPSIETRIDPPKVDPGSPTGIQSRIDSSEAPLVRPDPVYPRTAQTRGIEGWVEIDEFGSAQGWIQRVKSFVEIDCDVGRRG
jgi:hypothetical protein